MRMLGHGTAYGWMFSLSSPSLSAGGDDTTLVVPWPDGKRQGKGVRVWSNGARYEGEWMQDEMHGFGVYVGPGE